MEFFASSFQAPFEQDDLLDGPRSSKRNSKLDLNEFLVKHPSSTFFMRIAGKRYSNLGLQDGDVVVIDRCLQARPGAVLLVIRDGSFAILRFLPGMSDLHIWGQITYVIRDMKEG